MFHYVKPYSNYYHFDLDEFDKTIQKLTINKHIISLKELDKIKLAIISSHRPGICRHLQLSSLIQIRSSKRCVWPLVTF